MGIEVNENRALLSPHIDYSWPANFDLPNVQLNFCKGHIEGCWMMFNVEWCGLNVVEGSWVFLRDVWTMFRRCWVISVDLCCDMFQFFLTMLSLEYQPYTHSTVPSCYVFCFLFMKKSLNNMSLNISLNISQHRSFNISLKAMSTFAKSTDHLIVNGFPYRRQEEWWFRTTIDYKGNETREWWTRVLWIGQWKVGGWS